jgi:hypothetical protein
MNKENFHDEINSVPNWIKSEDDLKKYCRHLKYRLKQSEETMTNIYSYLDMFHDNIDLSMLHEFLDYKYIEQEREYNEKYSNNASIEDILM